MSLEHFRDHCARQAATCRRMDGDFVAHICALLPDAVAGTALQDRIIHWPRDLWADAVALRLCGALHRLVIDEKDAALARYYAKLVADRETALPLMHAALVTHADFIDRYIDLPPQTNEIGRSAALLPGLLAVARRFGRPIALYEIGSSAGLNLNMDRFCYRYGDQTWGDQGFAAPIAPRLTGAVPCLGGDMHIASRLGCDQSPLDVRRSDDRRRLMSYLWPGQHERFARQAAAVEVFRGHPAPIKTMDAADFVEAELRARPRGQAFVLFHSLIWSYLDDARQQRIATALAKHGKSASQESPIAWLRLEGFESQRHAKLQLDLWPGGDSHHLADVEFHGRWIDWRPQAEGALS